MAYALLSTPRRTTRIKQIYKRNLLRLALRIKQQVVKGIRVQPHNYKFRKLHIILKKKNINRFVFDRRIRQIVTRLGSVRLL